MRYYPIFLDIKDRPCVVVGAGPVAERKVEGLLKAGAKVTVISPRVTKAIEGLGRSGRVSVLKRRYKKGDIKGFFLAISASGSKAVNQAVYKEAVESNTPVNVVDDPRQCSFIVPAIVDRGSLLIAVSTSAKSPYLAATLRKEIEKLIVGEYGAFTDILGAIRKKLLKTSANRVKKERVFKALVNSPIPRWLSRGQLREIDGFLENLLGPGYSLSKLGVKVKAAKPTGSEPPKDTIPKDRRK